MKRFIVSSALIFATVLAAMPTLAHRCTGAHRPPHHAVVVHKPAPVVVRYPARVVVARPTPVATAARIVTTAAIVASLPNNQTTIVHCGTPYYCHGGTYYIKVDNGYQQVEPPKSIIVYSLPEGYTKMTIEGKVQYIHNNLIYMPVTTNKGVGYKIVGTIEQ